MLVPRFVIDTDRAIDDDSVSGQNSTVAVPWKLTLGGVDEVTALGVVWARAVGEGRSVPVLLPRGNPLKGELHKDWSVRGAKALACRLADLKAACRQVAACPGLLLATVVAAWNEDTDDVELYLSLALLFGEKVAIHCLKCVSRFLATVARRGLEEVLSGYYDDLFTCGGGGLWRFGGKGR